MKLFWVKHCGFSEDIWGKLRLSDPSRGIMTYFVNFFITSILSLCFGSVQCLRQTYQLRHMAFSNNGFTHVFRWLNIINLASKENVFRYKECV